MPGAERVGSFVTEDLVGASVWVAPDIVYLEPRVAILFGVDPSAAHGVPADEAMRAIHPDDIEPVRSIIFEHMANGQPMALRYRLVQNRKVRWVQSQGQCIRDAAGKPLTFPAFIHDISGSVHSGDRFEALGDHLLEGYKLASDLGLPLIQLPVANALDHWTKRKRARHH